MLTTKVIQGSKYDYLAPKFKRVFDFLEHTDFTKYEPGKIEIDGDRIFAEVQEYTTIPQEECRFESHKVYFDVQYMAEGEEYFGYIPLEELTIDMEYDPVRDLAFYKEPDTSGRVHLRKGDFAIVSPEDGHKPRCIGKAPCKVKKIVVKIKVDL